MGRISKQLDSPFWLYLGHLYLGHMYFKSIPIIALVQRDDFFVRPELFSALIAYLFYVSKQNDFDDL